MSPSLTPAERARQIDREEFAAECAAIRERAYFLLANPHRRDEIVERWIRHAEPKGDFNTVVASASKPFRRPAGLHSAFGHSRTLAQWSEATGLPIGTIRSRLRYGWTVEQALTLPADKAQSTAKRKAGVVSNFTPSKGTGGRGTAQEIPNITFSGDA